MMKHTGMLVGVDHFCYVQEYTRNNEGVDGFWFVWVGGAVMG